MERNYNRTKCERVNSILIYAYLYPLTKHYYLSVDTYTSTGDHYCSLFLFLVMTSHGFPGKNSVY